jgi:hypothetical protein
MSDQATWEKMEGSRDAKPRASSNLASLTIEKLDLSPLSNQGLTVNDYT